MRVGYGGTNDHPFRSFGKWLLDRGEITPAQATMQGIKAGACQSGPGRRDAQRQSALRLLPRAGADQRGAGGRAGSTVDGGALDRGRSGHHPAGRAGLPVDHAAAVERADPAAHVRPDTGTAIKGGVRADFFWGRAMPGRPPAA